ncbi:MAG: DUF1786 domain-containing protein [Thermoleophilia bacterium]
MSAAEKARILAIDVGAGTTDVLLTQPGEPLENAVKLVVPSRTRVVAAEIDEATARGRAVAFDGPTMGGGACAAAMKRHVAAGLPFLATPEAALTFADDLERVRADGVTVVPEIEIIPRLGALSQSSVVIRSGDLGLATFAQALTLLGVDASCVDAVAIAAQDHGFSPSRSNRVVRFALWEAAIAARRHLNELFYAPAEIPADLTRLQAVARQAQSLAHGMPVLVADTGPAALYGALPNNIDNAVLVNIGNGHTFCVVALERRFTGVFEHHTSCLTRDRLEEYLRRFLKGRLTTEEVLADGGHGAMLDSGAVASVTELPILVTGPRRELLRGTTLAAEFAAPHGDMMLTGCFGLRRAVLDRFGAQLPPSERPSHQ